MLELSSPVCVVANDAGATNLIIGVLRDNPNLAYRFCVDGPALKLLKNEFPGLQNLSLQEALEGSKVLLSGTSGISELEHKARKLVHKMGIPSIGVIDHWVNYRIRFVRQDQEVLPDEIWVADEYAEQMAVREFPGSVIQRFNNRYLQDLVSEIRPPKEDGILKILYVLEPIGLKWGGDIPGEFQALNYFVKQIHKVFADAKCQIILRPHPSENPEKYEQWISEKRALQCVIDCTRSLSDLISWANVVAGCESYAMIVALEAGRTTYCSIPVNGPKCRLPHKGIKFLKEL